MEEAEGGRRAARTEGRMDHGRQRLWTHRLRLSNTLVSEGKNADASLRKGLVGRVIPKGNQ